MPDKQHVTPPVKAAHTSVPSDCFCGQDSSSPSVQTSEASVENPHRTHLKRHGVSLAPDIECWGPSQVRDNSTRGGHLTTKPQIRVCTRPRLPCLVTTHRLPVRLGGQKHVQAGKCVDGCPGWARKTPSLGTRENQWGLCRHYRVCRGCRVTGRSSCVWGVRNMCRPADMCEIAPIWHGKTLFWSRQ